MVCSIDLGIDYSNSYKVIQKISVSRPPQKVSEGVMIEYEWKPYVVCKR